MNTLPDERPDAGLADVRPLPADRGPTVLRIALGGHLRRLRESRGISMVDAGHAIRGSESKISRLELGQLGFKDRDLRDLLDLYRVGDPGEYRDFLDLARAANQPGWWQQYDEPSWFETYIGLEQGASVVRCYENQYIPGLLQTEDYARNIVALGNKREIPDRVAVRLRRQRILDRPDPPVIWAVIDEVALLRTARLRPGGNSRIAREQLEHLLALSERRNVTIQVLPITAGPALSTTGPFTLLRFPVPQLPDIVYVEQLTGAHYLDKPADLQQYRSAMDLMCAVQAQQPEDTNALLCELIDGL
ncbi:MAG: helix-turn-helix domain-containing protein [Mycobacteriaceae bacterium]|nr:helix-turn-helix domain-containing protein [Mycobacteriaceae bacterium]